MNDPGEFTQAAPPLPAPHPAHAAAPRKVGAVQAVAAITIGNALEFFDFTVYSFLAVTLGKLFFPVASPYGQLLMSTATFGVGFITRPIGGIVLGSYADRAGRKAAMLITLALMALGSGLIAFAPTYAQAGLAAPVIIVAARLIQGFSAGGEVGATTAILLEYATPRTRSFYSSWQFASQGLGVAIGALLSVMSARYLDHAAFMDWGWRIPFAVGMLVAPVGLYIRNRLEDTIQPRARHDDAGTPPSPLRVVLRDHWRVIILGLMMMAGGTSTVYMITFYMPTYAIRQLGIPMSSALLAGIVVGLILFIGMPLCGLLADRVDRRTASIAARIGIALAAYPAFLYLNAAPSIARLLLMVGAMITLHVLSEASMAIVPSLLPKEIRATGAAFIYAVGVVVIGGSSQFITTWLVHVTGSKFSPAIYLMACNAISIIALIKVEDRSAQLKI
jgi:MFS family permease